MASPADSIRPLLRTELELLKHWKLIPYIYGKVERKEKEKKGRKDERKSRKGRKKEEGSDPRGALMPWYELHPAL